ncbi:hypothetical protein IW01_17650 [Pectobacterium brasiliense]|uniref:hypothetical protein n=1 Tax=Pectobacterium brasiliense TaxID=180957 RepID=UPI0004E78FF6|nr:hypothetical protein [Pectobacterium brasiliense]KFF67174.1 hypothetical protein IW01_17650 [Pectobacterium brasiliense]
MFSSRNVASEINIYLNKIIDNPDGKLKKKDLLKTSRLFDKINYVKNEKGIKNELYRSFMNRSINVVDLSDSLQQRLKNQCSGMEKDKLSWITTICKGIEGVIIDCGANISSNTNNVDPKMIKKEMDYFYQSITRRASENVAPTYLISPSVQYSVSGSLISNYYNDFSKKNEEMIENNEVRKDSLLSAIIQARSKLNKTIDK